MEIARTLTVYPVHARVETELLASLGPAGSAALGLGRMTLRDLERNLFAACGLAPLGRAACLQLVVSVAPRAARGTSLASVAEEPGFASSFLRVYDIVREGGLGVAQFSTLARGIEGLTGRRLEALSRVARAYEIALSTAGAMDVAGARLRLPDAIRDRGVPPSAVQHARQIEVVDVLDFPVTRARILQALVDTGHGVQVILPAYGGRGALGPGYEQLRANLESDAPGVTVVDAPAPGGDLAPLSEALFDPDRTAGNRGVTLAVADDPDAELRWTVARVRALLAEGVSPERIAVAVRGYGAERDRLARAWNRAGIPWADRRGDGALDAPPCALALALLELASQDFPREELGALLESRYVEGGVPAQGDASAIGAGQVIRALREAGSRDDLAPGHGARLRQHAARLDAAGRDGKARTFRRIAERLDGLLPLLHLPPRAPVADHVVALWTALAALDLVDRTRRGGASLQGDSLDRAIDRAMGRDLRGLRELERACIELAQGARQIGAAEREIDLGTFHALLHEALSEVTLGHPGPRGRAVTVGEVTQLVGRRFDHVFVLGVVDGGFPRRPAPLPLLDDDDRRAVNRAVGRTVFRHGALEEPLLFAQTCAAAQTQLWITAHAHDRSGREAIASTFFDEVKRVTGAQPVSVAASVVTRAVDAVHPEDLLVRGALASRGSIPPAGDPDADVVLGAVRADAALKRRLELARVVGRIDGSVRLGEGWGADQRFAPGEDRGFDPRVVFLSSTSALESYAACPFRFFAERVLRLDEPATEDDELDLRDQGNYRHEVAAAVFEALRDGGLLPLRGGEQAEAENRVALEAAGKALEAIESRSRLGPMPYWGIHRSLAMRDTGRVLDEERSRYKEGDPVPQRFEEAFGEGPDDALLLPDSTGERFVALRGRVDRVDESGDRVMVVDYKLGNVAYRMKRDDLVRTAFQMVVYAAWARHHLEKEADATYGSLRFGDRARKSLATLLREGGDTLEDIVALDPEARRKLESRPPAMAVGARDLGDERVPNLADAVWSLVAGIRAGAFDVRPHDPPATCRFCAYRTVCRVDTVAEEEPQE